MRLIFLHTAFAWFISSYVSAKDIVKPSFVPYCTTRDRCKPACSCEMAPNCEVLELDEVARKSIVNYHNQIRDIQSSGEPIPGGMTMLQYDENLEQLSRCSAARCVDEFSECFITAKFNETSQAAVQITLQQGEEPKISLFMQMMNFWLGQAKAISAETLSDIPAGEDGRNIHNFAQLLSDRILYVGCAWSRADQVITFVCTYGPRGPAQGEAIYRIGSLCTLCPENYACDHVKPFPRLCKHVPGLPVTVQPPPVPPPKPPQTEAPQPPQPPPKPPRTSTEAITAPPNLPPFQTQPVIIPQPQQPPMLPSANSFVQTTQMPIGTPPIMPPQGVPGAPPPLLSQAAPVPPPTLPQAQAYLPPMLPQAVPPTLPQPQPFVPPSLQQAGPIAPPTLPQPVPNAPPMLPQAVPTAPQMLPQAVPTAPPMLPQAVPFDPPLQPPAAQSAPPLPPNVQFLPISPDPPPVPPRTAPMILRSTYPVMHRNQCPPRTQREPPPQPPNIPSPDYSGRERIFDFPPLPPQEPPTMEGIYSSAEMPPINTQSQSYSPPQPPPLPHISYTPPPPPRLPHHQPEKPPQPPPQRTFVMTPPPLPQIPPEPIIKPLSLPRIPTDPFTRPPYLPQPPSMEPPSRPPSLPKVPHQVFPHQFVQPMPPPRIPSVDS